MYHDRVGHRVAEGCRLVALGKRWGVMIKRTELNDANSRELLKAKLAGAGVPERIVAMAEDLWQSFERAMEQEQTLYEQVCQLARKDKMMARTAELPGYG